MPTSHTCDKMMMNGEQRTKGEDIMPINVGFKTSNETIHYFMKLMMAEKPGTKGEDIMPFNIGAKGCKKTKNFCCTELMITNEPGAKSADIMPFNIGPKRNNEIKNSYVNIDDGAVKEKLCGMMNLNNPVISHHEDNDKKNIIIQNEDLLKSDSTEIIKDIDVCTAMCVDKTDNITEKSEGGKTKATVNKESSDEEHKIQSSRKSSDHLIPGFTENGKTNMITIQTKEVAQKTEINLKISDTKKTVIVGKKHKVYKRRKNKTVQQHKDGIHDKSKRLVTILKLNITEACTISLVFLFVLCKIFTHKYTGFMMILTVISCENIPETSFNLRIDEGEIIYGKTAVLKCTTNGLRRLCDIKYKSRRWTKGSSYTQLITNGKSVDDSKFEEYVNKNCTEFELRINDFNERDVNVEYNFEYGFEHATINLTINKSKYRRYPTNQTGLLDIQCMNGNLILRLLFEDINPIPNCTANLQNIISPLNITEVNETIFSYDVAYTLNNILEYDESKGEIHIKCSYGTSFEFDKRKTFHCSSGTMPQDNSSLWMTITIVLSIAVCAAIAVAIICCMKRRKQHDQGGNQSVESRQKKRKCCCIHKLQNRNIHSTGDQSFDSALIN